MNQGDFPKLPPIVAGEFVRQEKLQKGLGLQRMKYRHIIKLLSKLLTFFSNLYKGTQVLIYKPVNKNFLEDNESILLNDPVNKTRFGISHNYIHIFIS